MNNTKNVFPVLRLFYGQGIRNSSSLPVTPRYGKLKTKQVDYGTQDGVPVHYKSGVFDKLLVQATWALGLTGAALGIQTFVSLVLGKKD